MSPPEAIQNQWGLPPERQGHAAAANLIEHRHSLRALSDRQIVDSSVCAYMRTIAGVECLDAIGREGRGAMVYAHGGGFRMGEATMWAGFASRLAVATGLRIIVPNYRLAPEGPFPNGLCDLASVYRAVCAEDLAEIFLGGDSAGGNLACSVVLNAVATRARRPAGAVLVSPWLDLAATAESYARNAATDQAFSRQAAVETAQNYLQGVPATDPYASPLLADLAGFPPVIVFASTTEVLVDDTLALIARLTATGSRVEGHFIPGMPHVWPILLPDSPETAATIDAVGRFVRAITG